MIESLFEELSSRQKNKSDTKDKISESPDQKHSENKFLNALPVVQKIVRRKIFFSSPSDASDLVQSIALRLWKWREKYSEKAKKCRLMNGGFLPPAPLTTKLIGISLTITHRLSRSKKLRKLPHRNLLKVKLKSNFIRFPAWFGKKFAV